MSKIPRMWNVPREGKVVMRQWYVDAWKVYGVRLFDRFTKQFKAGTETWWIALRIARNLMDIEWDLRVMEKKIDAIRSRDC